MDGWSDHKAHTHTHTDQLTDTRLRRVLHLICFRLSVIFVLRTHSHQKNEKKRNKDKKRGVLKRQRYKNTQSRQEEVVPCPAVHLLSGA